MNGATQTFRRPSVATTLAQQKDGSQSNNNPTPSSANVYVPPHMNSNHQSSYNRNGSSAETRYSKDQLLDLFKTQERNGFSSTNVNDLFIDGWSPGAVNGTSNGGWGKRDDTREAAGADICWDHEGSVNPIAIQEMNEEEREVYRTRTMSAWNVVIADEESPGVLYICQFATETANSEHQQGCCSKQCERQPANLDHTVSNCYKQFSIHTSWRSTSRIWRRSLAEPIGFSDRQ